jgi:hypothetical protein
VSRVHPAIATPLAAFDDAAVRWCLLRGARELDRLDGDVDLLVHPDDLRLVRYRLARMGGFRELRAWGRRPHRFFVANVALERTRLKLDVVTELAFGRRQELRTVAGEAVLARRIRDGTLARPAPADAFWALLLHLLLDPGTPRRSRVDELAALSAPAATAPSPLRTVVEAACPPGWDAEGILGLAATARLDELLALAPALSAGWPGTSRLAAATRASLRSALRRADRGRLRLLGGDGHMSGPITSNRRLRSAG